MIWAWHLARPLARNKRAVFFRMPYRLYDSVARSWRHGWDAGPTMPSNHLDGPSRGQVEEWLKRVNKRERRRKRRSKWSSVPPSYRMLHSHHRGHLDHSARELLFPTGGTLPISLVLQGVGRSKFFLVV
ncbi:hypothetical protein EE612_043160 [Oryza sativa]|nr:hypothetical protein EE612_043160 [Oryza sativa]